MRGVDNQMGILTVVPGAREDWVEVAKTIAAIAAIFLVLPVVLLKARDKGHLKTGFGVLAVLAGLGIAGALVNHFGPGYGASWDASGWVGVGLSALLLFLGVRWIRHGGPGIEHVPPDFQCEELKASVGKARAALPWFLEQVDKNVEGAYIKFPLRTVGGTTEHIWAYVHTFKNGAFNVALANRPFDPGQESAGRFDVPLEEVEDWQVMYPDGRIRGAYSVLALLEHFESRGKLTRRMRVQRELFISR